MTMNFTDIIRINPTVQINTITRKSCGDNSFKYLIEGYIDIDASSGFGGLFECKMKDKSFQASFVSVEDISTGNCSIIDLMKKVKRD